jgi:hypothetical protein
MFSAGLHNITVYGHEGCCDGAMDVRYAKNGETSYHSMNDFESVAPAALETTYSYDELRARCDEDGDGAVDFCEMEMCIIAAENA